MSRAAASSRGFGPSQGGPLARCRAGFGVRQGGEGDLGPRELLARVPARGGEQDRAGTLVGLVVRGRDGQAWHVGGERGAEPAWPPIRG
jgi:hypothetical protein